MPRLLLQQLASKRSPKPPTAFVCGRLASSLVCPAAGLHHLHQRMTVTKRPFTAQEECNSRERQKLRHHTIRWTFPALLLYCSTWTTHIRVHTYEHCTSSRAPNRTSNSEFNRPIGEAGQGFSQQAVRGRMADPLPASFLPCAMISHLGRLHDSARGHAMHIVADCRLQSDGRGIPLSQHWLISSRSRCRNACRIVGPAVAALPSQAPRHPPGLGAATGQTCLHWSSAHMEWLSLWWAVAVVTFMTTPRMRDVAGGVYGRGNS